MVDKYSPTWITDNFPLGELDCQFFDECQFYSVGKCDFSTPCRIQRKYEGLEQSVRTIFRQVVDPAYVIDNERFQIRLINDSHGKN